MEKVTEHVKGGYREGRTDYEAEGEIPVDRLGSVMEMYRWLKEQVKEGADEEELERVWEKMKMMNRLP